MRRRHSIIGGLVRGFLAGTVATWAMNRVTTLMYERGNREARRREFLARHGRTAYETAAQKIARYGRTRLTRSERQDVGAALHWAVGSATAALYGAVRDRLPGGLARGLAFGALAWVLVDNLANYALKLAPGPGALPWQTHARGLAGHLTYGAVTDAAMRVMR